MTLILIALWIAGHTFAWWWLIAAVAVDMLWTMIKLNFLAVLVRRSIEDTIASILAAVPPPTEENPPPPGA